MNAATDFLSLHRQDMPFVLGNAWDAGSARLLEQAGFSAIGTTSAGIAWSCGWPDNEQMPVNELLSAVRRIQRGTQRPVSVDIEAGFGLQGRAFETFIEELIDTGIVGVNLQDAIGLDGGIGDAEASCRRITQIRQVAERTGSNIFINARTDIFWVRSEYSINEKEDVACNRAQQFHDAGADGLFLPGCWDRDVLRRVHAACGLPLNVLAHPALDDLAGMADAGVRRISLGSGLFRKLFGGMSGVATALAAGHFGELRDVSMTYEQADALFGLRDLD